MKEKKMLKLNRIWNLKMCVICREKKLLFWSQRMRKEDGETAKKSSSSLFLSLVSICGWWRSNEICRICANITDYCLSFLKTRWNEHKSINSDKLLNNITKENRLISVQKTQNLLGMFSKNEKKEYISNKYVLSSYKRLTSTVPCIYMKSTVCMKVCLCASLSCPFAIEFVRFAMFDHHHRHIILFGLWVWVFFLLFGAGLRPIEGAVRTDTNFVRYASVYVFIIFVYEFVVSVC